MTTRTYEKPGSFYLGRPVENEGQPPLPFLYDSPDLTTHAVCVGMTGSGKTGLGIALLEEAAIDGIPAIVIDPKGDLTNLALQFPDLAPEDFRPWISADEAARQGLTPEAFAAAQAELWRKGLARWDQDGERIARLRRSAEVVVYTPGSTAGRPVSIVGSFEAPPPAIREDAELFAAQIETEVTGLLTLLGRDADPIRSREAVLLCAIVADAWGHGESLTLEELARRVDQPPFERLGMMEVENVLPELERFQLLLALNNLFASPGFTVWREGEPLDIQRFLYTPEGRPRLAVFSIAHLGDAERMFFVSLLLSATLSWMRRQPGTGSLRALLYMDEIFGYCPPVGNPPSKKPILHLLKQARAFGLGVVLATQNPVDLDYKGLSNAGTWFIGRLQTERDKLRLLDGLGGIGLDRARIDTLLSRLGKRVFLMNNVHENEPLLFETRWCLSYLCGPLTREQIRRLPQPPAPTPEPTPAALPQEGKGNGAPVLPGIRQVYHLPAGGSHAEPALIGVAEVRFRDERMKIDLHRDFALCADFPEPLREVDWENAASIALADYQETPPARPGLNWGELPGEAARAAAYKGWEKGFLSWLVHHARLTLPEYPELGLVAGPEESEGDFRARVAHRMREERDVRVAALRERYAREMEKIERRHQSAQEALRRHEAAAGQSRVQTWISTGAAILAVLLSRKKLSATNVNRAGTVVRGWGRSSQKEDDLNTARERLAQVEEERDALEEKLETEINAVPDPAAAFDLVFPLREIRATRTGTRVKWMALGWGPGRG